MATGTPKYTFLPYISPGELRYCYQLQEPQQVKTASGSYTTAWNTIVDQIWCGKIPMHGSQMYYANSFAPKATAFLRTRYREDIEAGMRFVDRTATYLVVHPPIDIQGNNAVLLLYVMQLRVDFAPDANS